MKTRIDAKSKKIHYTRAERPAARCWNATWWRKDALERQLDQLNLIWTRFCCLFICLFCYCSRLVHFWAVCWNKLWFELPILHHINLEHWSFLYSPNMQSWTEQQNLILEHIKQQCTRNDNLSESPNTRQNILLTQSPHLFHKLRYYTVGLGWTVWYN